MTAEFVETNEGLSVLFNGREFPLVETEDGVLSPSPNLYSLALEDGILVTTDRVPPEPTSPLGLLWKGVCTIYEYQEVNDEETYQTKHELFPVVVNEPCRISFTRETSSVMVNGAAVVAQTIMLFIRPDLEIKPGSVIEVTQHNRTVKYKSSSKTALYTNHQEVVLEMYEEHA